MEIYDKIISFVRGQFEEPEAFIPLHEPRFIGKEKEYVTEVIDSTFVSYVGPYVSKFEEQIAQNVGSRFAVATNSGTSALHIALLSAGVGPNDEVITQPLTFVATVNAIRYINASPVFVDVDRDTLGLSPEKLKEFLEAECEIKNGTTFNKKTGRKITACMPVHTFGFPCRIDSINETCDEYNIVVVEDAAESLGSYYKNKHTGTFGKIGAFSFNGNKTITCGGGGMVVTDDEETAKLAKHLTTTAKVQHPWEYVHDMVGYNYRMPNLNAAVACAQLEKLADFVDNKRELAKNYIEFFADLPVDFIEENDDSKSNYWLMALIFESLDQRNDFLKFSNDRKVMTRPIWKLMNKLGPFKNFQTSDLSNSEWFEQRVVNIPSSVRLNDSWRR